MSAENRRSQAPTSAATKTNPRMPKTNTTIKETSGLGYDVENEVVALALAHLLTRTHPFTPPGGAVVEVHAQLPPSEWPLDDLVVISEDARGTHRVALSVKSNAQVTTARIAPDFVRDAWTLLLEPTSAAFDETLDFVGLVADPLAPKLAADLETLLREARERDPADLDDQVHLEGRVNKTVRALHDSARCPADLAQIHGVDARTSAGRLLRRMVWLGYDGLRTASTHRQHALLLCRQALAPEAAGDAEALWHALGRIARTIRAAGGSRDRGALLADLQGSFRLADAPVPPDVNRQILDRLLARDEVSGALRQALERQAEPVAPLVEAERLTEAVGLLQDRVRETEALGADAGPVLRDLLDRHLLALRVQLGNVLARAADHDAAADQLAAIGDPAAVPDDLVFEAARLAHNTRSADALAALHARLAPNTDEHRETSLWVAITNQDWEGVLVALDAFERDDPGRAQTRARALLELGRDRPETARLLDEAWATATRAGLRLAIAGTTTDLVEAVVEGEEEASGLDRPAAVAAASERLRAVAATAPTPTLGAFAHFRAVQWYAFLDDRELHTAAGAAFEALVLTDAQRLRFVVDADLDDDDLLRLVKEGAVDPGVRDWIRAQRLQASGDARREERALWSAFDGLPSGPLKDAVTERLVEVKIEAEDEPGARAVLDDLPGDHPLRPLFAAKIAAAFEGEGAARSALDAVLAERPRCRPALRSLAAFTVSAALDATGGDRDRLVARAETLLDQLAEVLPSRSPDFIRAGMYLRLGRPADAVRTYEALEARGEGSVLVLTSKATALAQAGRLPDAARALEEAYALDPTSVGVAADAGQFWLQAVQFDEARRFLDGVVDDHPDAALPWASLGFARLNSTDEAVRRTALAALETSLRLDPTLGISPLALAQAASAADDPVASRRYWEQIHADARHVEVQSASDVGEVVRLEEGEYAVQGQFDTKDSLRAFLEFNAKEAEAYDTLATSDMAPYASIARRPWSQWLSATRAFEERDLARAPEAYAVRAPWPSEAMLRPLDRDDDRHPIGPASGLLVDLTALLTLASLGALDEVLRTARDTFGRIVLYPEALDDLRDEIHNLSVGLAWQDRQPTADTLAALDRHRLGPHPSDPSPADLAALVPDPAADELGNSAPDVGLALRLGAGFVGHPTQYDTEAERQWGGRTWTSAEVLHALRRENRLGRSRAETIAEGAPRTFAGWEAMDPPPLTDLVVTGFVLTDWYASGLLDLWVQNRASWPSLRVGPFGVAVLQGNLAERERQDDLIGRLRDALATLDDLLSAEVVELLPALSDTEDDDEDVLSIWDSAVALIQEAAAQNLHLWADDRALGFLLWRYGTPVSGPEIDGAVRRLRARFEGTSLLSTEMVLEGLAGFPDGRAAKLGWRLFNVGVRPLLGRLALRHLLADFGPPFDGAPYDRLFAATGALRSLLPPETVLPDGRREAYLNVAAVPVLDALLDVAWHAPGLGDDDRTALADAVLDACAPLLDGVTAPALGLSVARLLLSMGEYRERQAGEDAPPTAEAWLGDALSDRLPPDRLRAVACAVEDMAIVMYQGLRDRAMADAEPDAERVISRIAARIAWQRLVPLFASTLINVHAPIVRRVFAALAGVPEAGQATRTVRRGTAIPLDVEEDEMEAAAVNAFWAARDDDALRHLVGLTRVHGVWKRPVPDDQKTDTADAPDHHPVELDVPYLALALRDEDDAREVVALHLAQGLDLVDPALRETVRDLHSDLVSGDADTRARALDRLADAAIGSFALDLERDLAHAVDRLRDRPLDELNAWLYNPPRPRTLGDHPRTVEIGDAGRMPATSLSAVLALSLDASRVEASISRVAQQSVQSAEESGLLDVGVTATARQITTAPSSFEAVYQTLVLLDVARQRPNAEVSLGSSPVPVSEWVRELVADLLVGDAAVETLRPAALRATHAFALRLALHACSDPDALSALHDKVGGDDARLAGEWTSSVLVASDRLLAFAEDRYPDPLERAYVVRAACETLGFRLDLPGRTFDRFNPMLFGPGLVNHERWVLLHALDVQWSLSPDEVPLWWSERAREALRTLADHPEPHEDLLLTPDVQNGLGLAMDAPSSRLARRLLDRADVAGSTQGPEAS